MERNTNPKWQDFNQTISDLNAKDWVYRGQRSSTWNLQSSLYREITTFHEQLDNRKCINIENEMVQEYNSSSIYTLRIR